jgi:hypothetical protein
MTETFTIKPLEWDAVKVGTDLVFTAKTPFGFGYYVEHREGVGWSWSYCFVQAYDEDEFPCEGEEDGKAMAWGHWRNRMMGALAPVTPDIAAPETDINVSTLERAVRDWGQFNQSGMFKGGE